jgi:hypothetical protein
MDCSSKGLEERLECAVHLEFVVNEAIQLFTLKTWKTLRDCVDVWCNLDGKQRVLAESFLQIVKLYSTVELSNLKFGYHATCYCRFIDKRTMNRAEIRCAKRPSDEAASNEKAIRSPAKKLLRSKSGLPIRSTSNPVLPAVCIICKRVNRYITIEHKRVKDKLVKAETTTAGRLEKAAGVRSDEGILLHIRQKDCSSIEVRYHQSCYKLKLKVTLAIN